MDEARLKALLQEVASGRMSVDTAAEQVRTLPLQQVEGFAHLDTHRDLRVGFPEVVFCAGKTDDQIVAILRALAAHQRCVLATRMTAATAARCAAEGLGGTFHEAARCYVIRDGEEPPGQGRVVVVCAGTSDLPVAEEAAVTAATMGSLVERIYDVGVAGIHRLLRYAESLREANAIVVVAGMEGALPSVVGGLVACPVLAVPTSIGYGASFGGLAPLLGMLNTCSAGVSVLNIDNGFGGGYCAHVINHRIVRAQEGSSCA